MKKLNVFWVLAAAVLMIEAAACNAKGIPEAIAEVGTTVGEAADTSEEL